MSEVKTDKISSVSTNGDITLDPDGTGDVVVASGHNLGVGTATPNKVLHIETSGETVQRMVASTTNLAGFYFGDSGNGSIGQLIYDNSSDAMRFNTNGSERMRVNSSGNLLLGTSSDISGGQRLAVKYSYTNPGAAWESDNVNVHNAIVFKNPNGTVGTIRTAASAVQYNTSSDYRLKENVADMTGAIARVKQLAPKRFNFIADADTTVDGFLAHEAQAVVPEAVSGTHNEVDDDGNAVMQGIDQSKLVPLLTGALREAIAKIEALEARVTALEDA